MKNKKLITLICCLALVTVVSLGATIAYLTANATVTNTFTVGKINEPEDPENPTNEDPALAGFLDELKVTVYGEKDTTTTERVTGNEYKLIPGHTYTKDPTVHIGPDSEACYVFVKIENGISAVTETISLESGWTAVEGETNVWYQKCAATGDDNANFVVFKTFTVKGDADATALAAAADKNIKVTAYIIQADGLDTAAKAWAEVKPEEKSSTVDH